MIDFATNQILLMATYNNSNKSISKPQDKHICIYSFNSRGFNLEKQQFCRDLLCSKDDVIPILCNQENFILKSNSNPESVT